MKPKTLIIGLSTALVITSVTAIAVPIGISINANSTIAQNNKNKVSNVQTTFEWKQFTSELLKKPESELTIEFIQSAIDNQKANWSKWIEPIDGNNNVNHDLLKSINNITVVDNNNGNSGIYFTFDFTWADYVSIDNNLVNQKFITPLSEPIKINWNNNASSSIQKLIDDNQPENGYASLQDVSNVINNPVHQNAIIGLTDQSDKIREINFSIVSENNSFTIVPVLTMNSPFIIGSLASLTGIKITINVTVEWIDFANASNAIQTIVGTSNYKNIAAIQNQLTQNSLQIKTLMTSQAAIGTINYFVSQAAVQGTYQLTTTISFNPGYAGNTNLDVIEFNANVDSVSSKNVKSVNQTQALIAFKERLMLEGNNNQTTMQNLINREQNQWTNWIEPRNSSNVIVNEAIEMINSVQIDSILASITFRVTWSNQYQVDAQFAQPFSFQLQEIPLPNDGIRWISVKTTDEEIQRIVDEKNFTTIAQLQNELNGSSNQFMLTLLREENRDKVASITYQVVRVDGDEGSVSYNVIPTVTLIPGYYLPSGVTPLDTVQNIILK